MKAGFIGLGRMGQAMARRLLDGGHDLGVYNRTAEKLKPLAEHGAKPLDSIKAAATYGEAVFTMLADDAAVIEVAGKPAGLVESLPDGGVHICAGTHSVACIAELKERHGKAGQILLATLCVPAQIWTPPPGSDSTRPAGLPTTSMTAASLASIVKTASP